MAMAVAISGVSIAVGVGAEKASAANGALFDPGYIISDQNFYDSNSMSVAQIQSFLNGMVPTCRATTGPACLKNYTSAITSKAAVSGRCNAIAAANNQSAATIIWTVAQACGISPRVLLVLMEKEEGLVRSTAPSAGAYKIAAGYGCPDTAACDTTYYGFFNQLYAASKQFKTYAANPNGWSYKAGQNNNIRLSPDATCGTKSVYIRNQATASLYIYTPYTPNAQALANLYGLGNGCSSYGNRNFWTLYTDWFGSTTGDGSPYGAVAQVAAGYNQIQVGGWAVDPDSTDPIRVHVYVDGAMNTSFLANTDDPALAGQLGAGNIDHSFSANLAGIAAGPHSVCVFGINVAAGANTLLLCSTVTVQAGNPIGVIDQASPSAGTVYVRGWAFDPDSTSSIGVRMLIDSAVVAQTTASAAKPSLATSFPGYGANHAFELTASNVAPGTHSVCIQGVNVAAGADTTVACKTVAVVSGNPTLFIDEASAHAPGQLTVRGWAIDPDVVGPVRVHIYVDGGLWTKVTADVTKASLATAYPGYGAGHAFSTMLTDLPVGNHSVCVYAIGVGAGGNSSQCSNVATPTGSPNLHLDQLAGTDLGVMTIRGWAVDPDSVGGIRVHIYVDGVLATKVTADTAKAGIGTAFPGYGDSHSFSTTIAGIAPGSHSVCLYAINEGGGGTTGYCKTTPSFSGSPVLLLDQVAAQGSNSVLIRGWAIDPDSLDPQRVHIYVDGVLSTKVTADMPKASLATAYPPFGANHAFSTTVPVGAGVHQVCIYSINVGAGGNTGLCQSVTTL